PVLSQARGRRPPPATRRDHPHQPANHGPRTSPSRLADGPAVRQGGWPLRLARGDRGRGGRLEGGGKQVASRQAAVGPPFLGDVEDFLLAGEVVEPVGGLDGLTKREVARQDHIFSLERDEEGALYGPGTNSRDRGELRHELLVWQ